MSGNNGFSGGIWESYNSFEFRADAANSAPSNGANTTPEVAFDGNHRFATVWSESVTPGTLYSVKGAINAGTPFTINTTSLGRN